MQDQKNNFKWENIPSNIEVLDIPEGITQVPAKALCYKTNLKVVKFPKSMKSIASEAFKGCKSLKKIEIPCPFRNSSFTGCESLEEVIIGEGVTDIPGLTKDSYGLTANTGAFAHMKNLKKVVLPSSLKKIGEGAFCGCEALSEINLPSSLTEIKAEAFCGCSSLKSITIPCDFTNSTFNGCSSLENVVFGDGVTTIPGTSYDNYGLVTNRGAFYNMKNLKNVSFGKSVKRIGYEAFANSGLVSVTIPCTFSNTSFHGCSFLEEVIILNGVQEIPGTSYDNNPPRLPKDRGAFYGFKNLKKVIFPKYMKKIGEEVFFGCEGLEEITLPDFPCEIGINSFRGCSNLKRIYNLPEFKVSSFYFCPSIEEIEISEGVKQIPGTNGENWAGAFEGKKLLKRVNLPKSLQKIGNLAFRYCQELSKCDVPKGCKIGKDAFYGTRIIL